MKKTKFVLYFLIFGIGVFVAARCYYAITDDFRISNITYELPYNPDWSVSPPEDPVLVEDILEQELRYIGKGAQSYVFGTVDGNYVVKFIKFKHHKVEKYDKWKLLPFMQYNIDRRIAKHQRKLNAVFDGYSLAYRKHRDSTGLITLHLNRTNGIGEPIIVIDKVGIKRKIDRNAVAYIVQKRATVTKEIVDSAIANNDWDLVEKTFIQLFDFYVEEFREGLYDRDRSILTNTGFIDRKPVRIDAGKFTESSELKDPQRQYQEFQEILARLQRWVDRNRPYVKQDFHYLIDNRLQPYVLSITGN